MINTALPHGLTSAVTAQVITASQAQQFATAFDEYANSRNVPDSLREELLSKRDTMLEAWPANWHETNAALPRPRTIPEYVNHMLSGWVKRKKHGIVQRPQLTSEEISRNTALYSRYCAFVRSFGNEPYVRALFFATTEERNAGNFSRGVRAKYCHVERLQREGLALSRGSVVPLLIQGALEMVTIVSFDKRGLFHFKERRGNFEPQGIKVLEMGSNFKKNKRSRVSQVKQKSLNKLIFSF